MEFGGVKDVVVTKATIGGVDKLTSALIVEPDFAGTEELDKYLKTELEAYKVPKRYLIMDKFPLNEHGKTNLKAIKEIIENQN
ncbi:MAG: hypothetical protein IKV96_01630 [Firmicutes bacterium]|nr:hypothetical protein [Bacillota bacterium]